MKKIFVIVFSTIALSSCTIYQYSGRQANINRSDIQATPTLVDVQPDFTKRVTATSDWLSTREDAMAQCRFLAITENKVDIVVDPIYQVQFRPSRIRNKYKVTMSGFAGYYQNARTVGEDMKQASQFTREQIENYMLIHTPEVIIDYLYENKNCKEQGDVINIFQDNKPRCHKPAPEKAEPAPAPAPQPKAAPAPAPAPASQPKAKSASQPKANQAPAQQQPKAEASAPAQQPKQQSTSTSTSGKKTGFRKRAVDD